MIAMFDWFDHDLVKKMEEAAIISQALKLDIPIPKTYKEAVQDPRYGRQWEEGIKQ